MKDRESIEKLIQEHQEEPHLRKLQRALAEEITERVHGADELQNAIEASGILFGNSTEESLRKLNEKTFLAVFAGVPQYEIDRTRLKEGIPIVDLLATETPILPSKGEARKMVQGNGISINKSKVDLDKEITESDLVNDKYILAQRGKRNYFIILCN